MNTATVLVLAVLLLVQTIAAQNGTCVNNPDFRHGQKKKRSCRQIRNKESRRIHLCRKESIRNACPQTCGLCCENDDTYEFKLKNSDKMVDCRFITKTKNPWKKLKRFQTFCTDKPLYNFGGRTVRDACPSSCGFCKTSYADFITQQPTGTPTTETPSTSAKPSTHFPSSEPSASPFKAPSGSPSSQPTRPPSPLPSPFPTLKPTTSMPPSEYPTSKPSPGPTALPSSSPSDAPTSLPSPSPSDVPSSKPSVTPTNVPTFQPTKNPTQSIKPSASPTFQPTKIPTQSIKPSPTPTSDPTWLCKDETSFMFSMVGDENDERNCGWLTASTNAENTANRLSTYCPKADVNAGCCDSCQEYEVENSLNIAGASVFEETPESSSAAAASATLCALLAAAMFLI